MGARLSCVLVVLGTLGCGGGDDPVQALLQGLPPDLTISCDPDGGTVFRGTVDLTPVLELGAGFDRLFMRIQDIAGPLAFRVDGQPSNGRARSAARCGSGRPTPWPSSSTRPSRRRTP